MPSPFHLSPLVWANDLVAEPEPEYHWVVPGFLERRDRLIVTGGEGEGKSTWFRQTAVQIASGVNPFTLEQMEPKRVVLLDVENSREQLKKELVKICERAELPMPGQPYLGIANWPQGLNLLRADYEAALDEWLGDPRPDIVLGGPLYKLMDASLADEEASKKLSTVLDRLREKYGFALGIEAHQINEQTAWDQSKKMWTKQRATRPFGSSLWRRWPEFGVCLFTDGTLFHWRQGRQSREWPRRLQRDGDTWLWQVDNGACSVCGEPRAEGKDAYCSDKCKNTAKKRRQRARGELVAEEML